jgi:hypothetical protein
VVDNIQERLTSSDREFLSKYLTMSTEEALNLDKDRSRSAVANLAKKPSQDGSEIKGKNVDGNVNADEVKRAASGVKWVVENLLNWNSINPRLPEKTS